MCLSLLHVVVITEDDDHLLFFVSASVRHPQGGRSEKIFLLLLSVCPPGQ